MFAQPVDHVETDIEERSNEMWTYQKVFHNQNFVVMSIVDGYKSEKKVKREENDEVVEGDEGFKIVTVQNPPAVKIFGTFSSLEEANRHSKNISVENDFFHVYVAQTNEWLPIPPSAEFIEDVQYQEERLQGIRDAYAEMKTKNAKEVANKIKKEDVIVQKQQESLEKLENK